MTAQRRAGRKDRLFRRYRVSGVAGTMKATMAVEVLDLSATGVRVATDSYLAVGKRYPFTLTDGDRSLQMTGEVRWCVLSATQKVAAEDHRTTYTAGISFDADRMQELLEMVQSQLVLEVSPLTFGHFQISDATSVVADLEFGFIAKQVSLNGAIVESEFAPPVGTTFDLVIDLAGEPFRATGRATSVARVPGATHRTDLALEFVDLTAAQTARLERFIEADFSTPDPTLDDDHQP